MLVMCTQVSLRLGSPTDLKWERCVFSLNVCRCGKLHVD